MGFLKNISKFLLGILTFVLMIVLTGTIMIFSVRDISSHYFRENAIKEMIQTIDITELFLDKNGNELQQITEIKQELVAAGIPVEVAEEFMNSKPVKEVIAGGIQVGVDYVIYDKKIETPTISANDIYNFFEENLPVVVQELQANNVPKSELLTEEKQQLVLQQINEKAPLIEEKVSEVVEPAFKELQNTDEYHKLEDYKNEASKVLHVIQWIYSKTVTVILLSIGILCMLLIMLSRRSFYKGFKWIGTSFILSGLSLTLITILLPFIKHQIGESPYALNNFLIYIFDDIASLCGHAGIVCFIIATILIVLNIIISIIREKRENKKFDI